MARGVASSSMPLLEVRDLVEEDEEGCLPWSIYDYKQTPRDILLTYASERPVARVWLSTVGSRRVCYALKAAFVLYCRQIRTTRRNGGQRDLEASVIPDCRSCGLSTGSWCDLCEMATCTACEHLGCTGCGHQGRRSFWSDERCRQHRNNAY